MALCCPIRGQFERAIIGSFVINHLTLRGREITPGYTGRGTRSRPYENRRDFLSAPMGGGLGANNEHYYSYCRLSFPQSIIHNQLAMAAFGTGNIHHFPLGGTSCRVDLTRRFFYENMGTLPAGLKILINKTQGALRTKGILITILTIYTGSFPFL